MDKILVTITGLSTIVAVYWFFFGTKDDNTTVSTTWNIRVDGGYQPKIITVPKGKLSTITFTRADPNTCLEEVAIPDFHIKSYLPLHKPITISISPTNRGIYDMVCGMHMFHGKVRVV